MYFFIDIFHYKIYEASSRSGVFVLSSALASVSTGSAEALLILNPSSSSYISSNSRLSSVGRIAVGVGVDKEGEPVGWGLGRFGRGEEAGDELPAEIELGEGEEMGG